MTERLPIRVFIGTEPKTEIARRVLEYSILCRTLRKVECTPMIGPRWEYPTEGITVGTGFSLRRWMIPAACQFSGRAIYLDADQLVLSDIQPLWQAPDTRTSLPGTSAWMTYQTDKFSPKAPWPQSSVMVIDCAAAASQWGWDIQKVLAYLRAKPDKQTYARFMHATWMQPPPGRLDAEWNHLNVFEEGKTRLLHYTKEPEQPWYKPDHPLAWLWQRELRAAIAKGFVSPHQIQTALSRWEVREDWRPTNGLHPHYQSFLTRAPQKRKTLWITSCAADMWQASGRELVNSFLTHQVDGELWVYYEGDALPLLNNSRVRVVRLSVATNALLAGHLQRHGDLVPKEQGGSAGEPLCRCPGGPLDVHAKSHQPGCLGYWFNKNHFRWLRKLAALQEAASAAKEFDAMVWLDADCLFRSHVSGFDVDAWFGPNVPAFFLQGFRPAPETGVVGFNLAGGGRAFLDAWLDVYRSGRFRQEPRWDDGYAWQLACRALGPMALDLAVSVVDHAEVVPASCLAQFLEHRKGRHGRVLGLMR